MYYKKEEYLKLWFFQIIAPVSFFFAKFNFAESLKYLLPLFSIIIASFFLHKDKSILRKTLFFVLCFLFIILALLFYPKPMDYFFIILILILILFPLSISFGFDNYTKLKIFLYLVYVFSLVNSLVLIPYYICHKIVSCWLLSISLSYSCFFMALSFFAKIKQNNIPFNKHYLYLLAILYFLAFLIIILFWLFYHIRSTLLLIIVFAYYAFLTVKLYMLERVISEKLFNRAIKLTAYSWIFFMLFLVGENSNI